MMYVYLDNDWFPNEIFKSAVVYPSEAWTLVKEHDCLKCKGLGKRFFFSSGYKECKECIGTGKFKYYQKIDEDWETFKKLARHSRNQICDIESKQKEVESVEGPLDSGSTTTPNKCEVCGGIGYFHHNGTTFTCGCAFNEDSPTKPSHYHEGGIDVFAYMQANFTKEEQRGFHKGTAIKYISRAGKKKGNSYEQDIAKAKVHIEELERLGEEG